jgi:hypothetical protein
MFSNFSKKLAELGYVWFVPVRALPTLASQLFAFGKKF